MKRIITLCLALLMIVGCGTQNQSPSNVFDGNFPIDKTLTISSKTPLSIIDPSEIIVSDSMIVLLLRHEPRMFQVYDKHSFNLLGSFLSIGNAGNEVQVLPGINQWDVDGNQMTIYFYSYPRYFGALSVNKSLEEGGAVFARKTEIPAKIGSIASGSGFDLGENKMLMFQHEVKKNYNGVDEVDDTKRLMVGYDFNADKELYSISQFGFNPSKVAGSHIFMGSRVISGDRKNMVHASEVFDAIFFYDLEKKQRKELFMSPEAEAKMYEAPVVEYYKDCVAAGDYVFVRKNVDEKNKTADASSVIEVFDWSGNAVAKLSFKETIKYFDVDEKGGQIYAILYNEATQMDEVVVYDLPF